MTVVCLSHPVAEAMLTMKHAKIRPPISGGKEQETKRYVIQSRVHYWDPWEVLPSYQYDTLEEAKKAFDALSFKDNHRIAESYVQVRYKPVRL